MTLERKLQPTYDQSQQQNATGTVSAPGEKAKLDVPSNRKDEPMYSRNSPTYLNIMTASSDLDDHFTNRYVLFVTKVMQIFVDFIQTM